jgi:pimeloyl-ACP methyl ester carboxylesterase
VFGQRDDVGLADDERRALEACPHVAVVTIPDAGHFTLNEEPGRIAELIIEMVSADTAR